MSNGFIGAFYRAKAASRALDLDAIRSNYIRVHVWYSGYHLNGEFVRASAPAAIAGAAGGKPFNVGHVSIQTANCYASLWPISGAGKIRPGELLPDLRSDIEAEEKHPDFVRDLFTLNARALELEFERFKKEGPRWTIVGANRLINEGRAESCSGLSYRLLVAAGIKKHVSLVHPVRDMIVTTPNNLAQLVERAYLTERKKYPQLANLGPDDAPELK